MLNRSSLFRYVLLIGFGGVAEHLSPQSEFASLSGRGNRFYDEDKDTGYGTNWSFAKILRCIGLKSLAEQEILWDKCWHLGGGFSEFAAEEVGQSIAARFEKVVRLYPDRLALKQGDRSFTFDRLNRAANRLDHHNCVFPRQRAGTDRDLFNGSLGDGGGVSGNPQDW